MSSWPEFLDPWRATEQGRRLQGHVAPNRLPRLGDLLATDDGLVQFEWEWFRDAQGRACVRGHVWGELALTCQRCLEPVTITLDVRPLLAVVRGDGEAARLPAYYEPLLVADALLQPLDLVADEVILALPTIPRHPENGCSALLTQNADTPSTTPPHPFRVLAQSKTSLH